MKTLAHLQVNPFIYSTYSSNNLSHRAAFFHGLYIIEYQMIPVQLNTRKAVDEVILTSLVPAQSERYQEATAELECFEWNDEKLE